MVPFTPTSFTFPMRTTLTLLAALPFALLAQTNTDIEVGGSMLQPNNLPYYDPQFVVINVGDMVTWNGVDGSHNAYGELDVFPNNPEGFGSGDAQQAPWVYSHTFTIPGTYDFHCTVVFQGMPHSATQFGTVTVLDPNGIAELSPWGEIALYPVPATENVTLKIPTTTPLTLTVYKSNGTLQQPRTTIQNGTLQLDVTTWNAGLYMVRLMDDNGAQVVRSFVVE